ncbi:hypothetical protein P8C59_003941 [Phyllachora maydis]|uniref:Nucleotide exchange factor SIL1 n=1 Tax=Phyllachora maydis TaxID=1825666 RepID=A0AAD9I2F1_9PEZI|nr:hypothetical protein P8C59_003941 [Phyllachora maydis]
MRRVMAKIHSQQTPSYDAAGTVKTPPAESPDFYKSLSILKKGLDIDEALEMLEEISHDIYYGLKIAEDFDTVRSLFCLANTGAIFHAPPASEASASSSAHATTLRRARLAALIIASATQNNPKALGEIERHWPQLQHEYCSSSSNSSPAASASPSDGEESLGRATFRIVSRSDSTGGDANLAKVRVSALSGLLRSAAIRETFLAGDGMDRVLEVLTGRRGAAEWEPARRRAGLLVMDNFLDENMGATLGEWPATKGGRQQLADAVCEEKKAAGAGVDGGCWDWWARRLADENRKEKGHWSGELWEKLRERTREAEREQARADKEL